MEFQKQFRDCYANFRDGILTIGNDRIERSWILSGKLPQVSTLVNKKTEKQWLAAEPRGQWETWPDGKAAFFKQGVTTGEMELLSITARLDNDLGVAQESLQVTVHLSFGERKVNWIHIIYPGVAAARSFLQVGYAENPIHVARPEEWFDDYYDYLPLDTMHCGWKNVTFTDVTDDNDNLVMETRGILTRRETRRFQGNVLQISEKNSSDGLLLVKEGPSTVAYLTETREDFRAKGMDLHTMGWGFGPELLQPGETFDTYGAAVILWDGEEEAALKALHQYNRAVRKFDPRRDAQIMSNTWGDGNADGRICEEFLMNELRCAQELGISYFQIDDGWESGTTCNSVNATEENAAAWGAGYYKSNPNFWAVNQQRLPNGLEPIVKYAKEHGITLGLWFSPDALHDYEDWRRDADILLNLHRQYGITAFKMDGLTFHNKRGEENFGRLMRHVVEGSGGEVFFNLDTTASVRNGYFGRVQYGSLFLENRFTKPFGRWPNYWPHHTLRNLWMLSRYMPSERLQIEFLNVKNNIAAYEGDPLAPVNWGQEMVFAISMFASPLAWMEMSVLDEASRTSLKKAISAYSAVQADILGGHVLPIGQEPDGFGWTGFQSVSTDGTGYILILREKNDSSTCKYSLWDVKNCHLQLQPILGDACQRSVAVDRDGVAKFSLEKPFCYALYRYTTTK